MSTLNCKPQQQTLSIRIPDSLREFLELSREFITDRNREAVSISDVAKLLLESARQDRLDFRFEAAELQHSPTSALLKIRQKWEQQQNLTRAEWVMLAQYVQVACEEIPASPDSSVAVLEALLAVRSLRTDRGGGLDRIYLGNLGIPVATVFSEHQFDAELLPDTVGDLIQNLRCGTVFAKEVVFAGRSLYVALREEAVSDIVALNIRLIPFPGTLFRLAARGHWFRKRQPLRMPRELPQNAEAFPPAARGPFQIAASVNGDGELELHLTMHNGGVRYPIGLYSEIREFEAMLNSLQPGQRWHGVHFSASAPAVTPEGRPIVHFWRRADFVEFTLSGEDWHCLRELFRDSLATPGLQPVLERLSLEYGEL